MSPRAASRACGEALQTDRVRTMGGLHERQISTADSRDDRSGGGYRNRSRSSCPSPAEAYLVTESQILDATAALAVAQKTQGVIRAAGGRTIISNRGKITPVVGDAPVRFGVSEWESIEKAQAYVNSPERRALEPERDKAIKFVRQFIIEEFLN